MLWGFILFTSGSYLMSFSLKMRCCPCCLMQFEHNRWCLPGILLSRLSSVYVESQDAGTQLQKYKNAELLSTFMYYVWIIDIKIITYKQINHKICFLVPLVSCWLLQGAPSPTQNLRAEILIHVMLGHTLLTDSHSPYIILLIFRRLKELCCNWITVKSVLIHYIAHTQSWSSGF